MERGRHRPYAAGCQTADCPRARQFPSSSPNSESGPEAPNNLRNEYIAAAGKVIDDPYVLVNVISTRVKMLRRGARPLVESLEKLELEDIALREVIEGKITYELGAPAVHHQ